MDKPPSLIHPQLLEELASLVPRLEAGGDPEALAHLFRERMGLCRVRGGFDWVTWKNSAEFRAPVSDPEAFSAATPVQVAKLFCTMVRQDRYFGGLLEAVVQGGVGLRLARRAAVLHAEEVGAES